MLKKSIVNCYTNFSRQKPLLYKFFMFLNKTLHTKNFCLTDINICNLQIFQGKNGCFYKFFKIKITNTKRCRLSEYPCTLSLG